MNKTELDIRFEDRRTPTTVPAEVASATAVASLLSIAQEGALVSNLAMANQVQNTHLAGQAQGRRQQSMSQLRLSLLAKAVGRMQSLSPAESQAAVAALTDNEAARLLLDLRATLAAFKRRR
ncbi:MAG: hypothetical protein EKK53_12690 [Burkholderiales bacterium]|nr:MAG: hypothetical protein EKK53_12690 [Burkholderiales bacterium]